MRRREFFALSLLVFLGVVLLWGPNIHAQGERERVTNSRYELIDFERRGSVELQVLDRISGRVYVLLEKEEAAVMFDPVSGHAIARVLKSVEHAVSERPPVWDASRRKGGIRYSAVHKGRRGSEPTIFDGDTGRLYLLINPTSMEIYDPVAGAIATQAFKILDETGVIRRKIERKRMYAYEAAAIGALKTISTAQVLFREADKDNNQVFDYGDLKALGATRLIDSVLASGTKQGYRFATRAAPATPEYLWMATAQPTTAGKTGMRYFVTNHDGVIFYREDRPFELSEDCKIPKGAKPIGR